MTVAIVNPSEESRSVDIKVDGGKLNGRGQKWLLTGKGRWSYNAPGKPRQVDITTASISDAAGREEVSPLSVTLYWYFLD